MNRIYLILCLLFLTTGVIKATNGIFEPEGNKPEELGSVSLQTDKGSKLDEASFWEKLSGSDDKSAISVNDESNKLYAPPPGEPGNPQKIVAPLGRGEVVFFLLLSVLSIGFYRKNKQKIELFQK